MTRSFSLPWTCCSPSWRRSTRITSLWKQYRKFKMAAGKTPSVKFGQIGHPAHGQILVEAYWRVGIRINGFVQVHKLPKRKKDK